MTEKKEKRVRWGEGKIEVLAVGREILERLEQGYPVKRIHTELKDAGRITVKLRAFYDQVKSLESLKRQPVTETDTEKRAKAVAQKASIAPHTAPRPETKLPSLNGLQRQDRSEQEISDLWEEAETKPSNVINNKEEGV